MIVVIADDFTGAAEMGGVALRYGLRVIIDRDIKHTLSTDVLVIATDTRSKNPDEARKIIAGIMQQLSHLQPKMIYKKTDSLLRGNVREELLEQLKASGKEKVLLIPANPALKRTIRNGVYYSDDVPLHLSSLANVTREKLIQSEVKELIGSGDGDDVAVVSTHDQLPDKRLVIGNTLEEKDLDAWVDKLSDSVIPAGGSSFFDAILKKRNSIEKRNADNGIPIGQRILYVCGSAFPLSREMVKKARASGRKVAGMPDNVFINIDDTEELIEKWKTLVSEAIEQSGSAIMAIDGVSEEHSPAAPSVIREVMSETISRVMEDIQIDELVIEGGATTFSVIDKLKFNEFYPVQELAPGVIRMKVKGNDRLFITMKPGSYHWPPSIWNDETEIITAKKK